MARDGLLVVGVVVARLAAVEEDSDTISYNRIWPSVSPREFLLTHL